MKLQIITQTTGRSGRVMQQKRMVQGDWIRVGRAASCEIHLADPRVALNQGLIMDRGGIVYSEGEAGIVNPGSTTRKAVKSVRLKPGSSIDVGPYKFTAVDPPPGYDGAMTIELVRPLEEAKGGDIRERASRLSLAALRVPKRSVAWLLLIAVAIVFFFIPAGRVLDLPWQNVSEKDAIVGDRFWNPGPVILAHQPFEMKCAACHEVAFEHVKDRACLECHQKIGHHVPQTMLRAVAAPGAGGGLFEGQRCTSCHLDHKGTKTTHRDNDKMCVDCHKDIRSKHAQTADLNVSDFAKDHPAFRLSIPTATGVKRVRMGAGPIQEESNLKFNHAVHLDAQGIKSPTRGRVKLECSACHVPDFSKRTFQPVTMQKNCQECHQLAFEPAVTTREAPHGNAQEARVVIEEFYANLALNGVRDSFVKAFGVEGEGLLRRVGEPSEAQRKVALNMASAKAEKVAKDLFRNCGECHAVQEQATDGKVDYKVAKVRPNNLWMPASRFDHKSHAQSPCADCHAVAKSKVSTDVAMPTIEDCRKCHGGSKYGLEKKLTSNCLMCHGFHDTKHPWDPSFKPRGTTRVAEGPHGAR